MTPRAPLLVTVFAFALALPMVADARVAGSSGMESRFIAVGPAGLKIVGTTNDGSVTDDGTTLHVAVPLGNLTTGISLRDKHMREKYLQTASYPEASLDVPRSAITFPKSGAEAAADVPAVLHLHGQNKTVSVHYTVKRDGDALHVSGAVHVNMNDFGIEVPRYMGITVKPEVDVTVRFDAVDR
jgi:polyisoprenoid-binding protein YceI